MSKQEIEIESVLVQKQFELAEGEELQSTIRKVIEAADKLRRSGGTTGWLVGIYKDHVILRDWNSDKFFRAELDRSGDEFKLTDVKEVRQAFLPVADKVAKSADPMLVSVDGDELELPFPKDMFIKSPEGSRS